MMNRIFRDSTTAADIPSTGLEGVMGYANGTYQWKDSDWRQFSGLPWVSIDVLGTDPRADILDYENGDVSTIPPAATWVSEHKTAVLDYPPILYSSRDNYSKVLYPHFGSSVRYIVATLDGSVFTGPDVIGCQWKGEKQTGAHYDETLIYDNQWLPIRRGVLVTPDLQGTLMIARDRAHAHWTTS